MIQEPEKLARKLGLHFRNPLLVKRALTHRSAESDNNERLEFLGDSVLGFVIAERLYGKFRDADEGVLSRLRAMLVNQTSLANLARKLNLGDYLILGSGELKSGGYRRDSILSDALEALIGALLVDQGMDACRHWILNQFAEQIDALSVQDWKKDPKTRLQEAMQARGLELPVYILKSVVGQPHDQTFVVECRIALTAETCEGTGSSRKKAEQQAAEKMLAKLVQDFGFKS
ncbi:ribonuclease III [Methylomagnum ishizawai]|uniref:ribonuclease III n=1 Tax=Methylomagnum ishizawai TaxID=1760988 RepID=UPI001C323BE3|nr:ribonuclease III [Methylomagnum ishizawai]BBL76049.1 ribonuclease 3 [Methylomagnum ishizawai]